jgi:roadblock/LC7 domain-containing protein
MEANNDSLLMSNDIVITVGDPIPKSISAVVNGSFKVGQVASGSVVVTGTNVTTSDLDALGAISIPNNSNLIFTKGIPTATDVTYTISGTPTTVYDGNITISGSGLNCSVRFVINPADAIKSVSLSTNVSKVTTGATTTITGTISAANFTVSSLVLSTTSANSFDTFTYTSGNTFTCRVKTATAAGTYNLSVVANSGSDNITSNTVAITVEDAAIKSVSLSTNVSKVTTGATTTITGTISAANFIVTSLALSSTSTNSFDTFTYTSGNTFTCRVKTATTAGTYNLSVVANSGSDNITSNAVTITVEDAATKSITATLTGTFQVGVEILNDATSFITITGANTTDADLNALGTIAEINGLSFTKQTASSDTSIRYNISGTPTTVYDDNITISGGGLNCSVRFVINPADPMNHQIVTSDFTTPPADFQIDSDS